MFSYYCYHWYIIITCVDNVKFPKDIEVNSAEDMPLPLTPLLGKFAGVMFSIGLFETGFSTVLYQVTIRSYYVDKVFGKEVDLKSKQIPLVMVTT